MPTPPADFDAFLENPANDRELHSVFSSALTLTSLVDAGAIRQHLGAWGASLAPRLVERLKPLIARWTPDETSLVAALAGDPGLFEAEVRVLAERAENVRARAEEADVTAQRAILEVAKAAQAQIRLRTQTASSDRTALSRLLDLLNGVLGSRPVAELPDLGTLPEALRHTVLDVAKEVLRGEILLAVAAQLDEIVTRARGRLEAGQKGREALDAARDRIRRIVGERIAALPRREGILPQDIVLDDDAAISRLVRKAPPFDATLQVENLDAATR